MNNDNPIISLRKRFVSDQKIPIEILYDDHVFLYFIDLYESSFGSRTKYNELIEAVNNKFDRNPSLFLENYYNVREKLITELSENEYMKEFNDSKNTLSAYELPKESRQYPSKSIYNNDNNGKMFVSFDLKKANFSALMYHEPRIFGSETPISFEEWIGKYTDLKYIIESKYTRQVVFGKLNPARQIKVEKYMIWQALKVFDELFKTHNIDAKIASFNVDEVVFETNDGIMGIWDTINNETDKLVSNNIPVKPTLFKVILKRFKAFNGGLLDVYMKEHYFGSKTPWMELKSVPSFFYAQVHKLLNGMELNDYDLMFWSNDQPAKFMYPLQLVETDK